MFKRFRATLFATALLLSCWKSSLLCADTPAQEFDRVFTQWKAADTKISDVIKAYREAEVGDRPKLAAEYERLTEQSKKLLPELRVATANAYEADPTTPDVEDTMIGLLATEIRRDRYESALELGSLLVKGKAAEPAIDAFVGTAAYCVDDFALAAKHLEKAKAAKALNSMAQAHLSDLPAATAAWKRESLLRKEEAASMNLPRVLLTTSKGKIVIELYENEAPKTVANFVSLVESGFYDGLTFHRVLAGFMAQGGCPTGTGTGGPGYKIPCECHQENFRRHFRGSLSMAHAGRDTGGSQFFLTFKRTPHLDGKHTVFGRVVEGLDVLAELTRRDPQNPVKPDRITKAEVTRKRDHDYVPTKVDASIEE